MEYELTKERILGMMEGSDVEVKGIGPTNADGRQHAASFDDIVWSDSQQQFLVWQGTRATMLVLGAKDLPTLLQPLLAHLWSGQI